MKSLLRVLGILTVLALVAGFGLWQWAKTELAPRDPEGEPSRR